MVDPIDYQLVLTYPDRDDPDTSDFTSFEGAVEFSEPCWRCPKRANGGSRRSTTILDFVSRD